MTFSSHMESLMKTTKSEVIKKIEGIGYFIITLEIQDSWLRIIHDG